MAVVPEGAKQIVVLAAVAIPAARDILLIPIVLKIIDVQAALVLIPVPAAIPFITSAVGLVHHIAVKKEEIFTGAMVLITVIIILVKMTGLMWRLAMCVQAVRK